jgi:hypothetical protein
MSAPRAVLFGLLLGAPHGAAALACHGRAAQGVGSARAEQPRASVAAAAWPDLVATPIAYPEAQAARTVAGVCTLATLSAAASAAGVGGALCARLVAGAPTNTEPLKLLGSAEELFVIDEEGCPVFTLREGSHAAADVAAAGRASFSAYSTAGCAQAGCGVTLVGPATAGVGQGRLKQMTSSLVDPCHPPRRPQAQRPRPSSPRIRNTQRPHCPPPQHARPSCPRPQHTRR